MWSRAECHRPGAAGLFRPRGLAAAWRVARHAAAVLLLATALTGCARNIKLKPLPAAKGGQATLRVELTYDRNDKIIVKVQGPEPSAYGPAFTRYVVWVATPDRAHVINVGQVRVENGKGEIQTLTPLRKFHLFLTVEEQGDVMKPGPQVVFEAPKEIDW